MARLHKLRGGGFSAPALSALSTSGHLLAAAYEVLHSDTLSRGEKHAAITALLSLADDLLPALERAGALSGGTGGRRSWARLHGLRKVLASLEAHEGGDSCEDAA